MEAVEKERALTRSQLDRADRERVEAVAETARSAEKIDRLESDFTQISSRLEATIVERVRLERAIECLDLRAREAIARRDSELTELTVERDSALTRLSEARAELDRLRRETDLERADHLERLAHRDRLLDEQRALAEADRRASRERLDLTQRRHDSVSQEQHDEIDRLNRLADEFKREREAWTDRFDASLRSSDARRQAESARLSAELARQRERTIEGEKTTENLRSQVADLENQLACCPEPKIYLPAVAVEPTVVVIERGSSEPFDLATSRQEIETLTRLLHSAQVANRQLRSLFDEQRLGELHSRLRDAVARADRLEAQARASGQSGREGQWLMQVAQRQKELSRARR